MQVHRPCVNIIYRLLQGLNQIACWLIFTILVIVFWFFLFMLLLYTLSSEDCSNYQYTSKCSRSAVSCYSTSSPFCQRSVVLAGSPQTFLSASPTLAPCLLLYTSLQLLTLRAQHQQQLSSWMF